MCDHHSSCHCCSCGFHRTIVNCDGVPATPTSPTTPNNSGTTPTPDGGGTLPSPPPVLPCNRALVRINSVNVIRSDAAADPGANAEWRLTVIVNSQSKTWSNDYVKDGTTATLGWDFVVDLVNASTTISIQSSGYEEDDMSANDPLPNTQQTHGSADNWGIGGTKQLSGNNTDFEYTINYTVTCLQRAARSVISRQAAVGAIQARLEARGVKTVRSEDELLTTFINKIAARGGELSQITPELLVWEGPTAIHKLIPEVFPVEEQGRKPRKGKVQE